MRKFCLAIMLAAPLSIFAATSQGETLERKMWDTVKSKNWDALDKQIAPYFQLAQFDKVLNKEQYLNHAKSSFLGDFDVSNFQVTEGPNSLIVTYDATSSQKVDGVQTSSKAIRLSVWEKNNNDWQMSAHAVLIPVPSAPQPKKPTQ